MKEIVVETLEYMKKVGGSYHTFFKLRTLKKIIKKRHGIDIDTCYLKRTLPLYCEVVGVVKGGHIRIYKYPKR